MHPYEVEIFVRQQQREIGVEIDRLQLAAALPETRAAWPGRLLWQLGRILIGCGRRLCRASGFRGVIAEPPERADLSLR